MRMHRTLAVLAVGVVACAMTGVAQGPEVIAIFEPDYRLALPGYDYTFPRDHGAHADYKLEWWYYTGHLDAEDGRRFGYELTFFRIGMDRRSANPSVWNVDALHVAHFALSDLDGGEFRFHERVNRAGPGIARAATGTLDVANGSWTAVLENDVMKLRAFADGVLLELELTSEKAPVVHGIGGVSQKAEGVGQASHYYSMTRMATTGLLSIDGAAVRVTGESWMDHEFGTNQLAPEQVGWDWFSIQFDDGEELMIYQLRRNDQTIDGSSSGTVVDADGATRHLTRDEFTIASMRDWASPKSEAVYRLDWRMEIPDLGADLRIVPLMDDQELVTIRSTGIAYWEGAVRIEGTWKGRRVTGKGYVELTGYGPGYRPTV